MTPFDGLGSQCIDHLTQLTAAVPQQRTQVLVQLAFGTDEGRCCIEANHRVQAVGR